MRSTLVSTTQARDGMVRVEVWDGEDEPVSLDMATTHTELTAEQAIRIGEALIQAGRGARR